MGDVETELKQLVLMLIYNKKTTTYRPEKIYVYFNGHTNISKARKLLVKLQKQ